MKFHSSLFCCEIISTENVLMQRLKMSGIFLRLSRYSLNSLFAWKPENSLSLFRAILQKDGNFILVSITWCARAFDSIIPRILFLTEKNTNRNTIVGVAMKSTLHESFINDCSRYSIYARREGPSIYRVQPNVWGTELQRTANLERRGGLAQVGFRANTNI